MMTQLGSEATKAAVTTYARQLDGSVVGRDAGILTAILVLLLSHHTCLHAACLCLLTQRMQTKVQFQA